MAPGIYIQGNPEGIHTLNGIEMRMSLKSEQLAEFWRRLEVFPQNGSSDEKADDMPLDSLMVSTGVIEEGKFPKPQSYFEYTIRIYLWATETGVAFLWNGQPVLIHFPQPPLDPNFPGLESTGV